MILASKDIKNNCDTKIIVLYSISQCCFVLQIQSTPFP